jgi:hypothetical protein
MRPIARPSATRAALAAMMLGTLLMAAPSRCGAGPRLCPGLEVGPLWGGMTGADRLASGGGDAHGHTGSSAAALLELAWPGHWGIATGVRYREVEETAPTGVSFFNGGLEYAYRVNTTLDLVSWPMLARVRPFRSRAPSFEFGPQLTWATHAETAVTLDLVGSPLGLAPARTGPARSDALIFELLSSGLTAEYRNLVLEGVVGLRLETPGVAHPPFISVRYAGGLTGITASSTGGERRTSMFEISTGWNW